MFKQSGLEDPDISDANEDASLLLSLCLNRYVTPMYIVLARNPFCLVLPAQDVTQKQAA